MTTPETAGLPSAQERGGTMTLERALSLFAGMDSDGWLQGHLAQTPRPQCLCGHCKLCAYQFFEALGEAHQPPATEGPRPNAEYECGTCGLQWYDGIEKDCGHAKNEHADFKPTPCRAYLKYSVERPSAPPPSPTGQEGLSAEAQLTQRIYERASPLFRGNMTDLARIAADLAKMLSPELAHLRTAPLAVDRSKIDDLLREWKRNIESDCAAYEWGSRNDNPPLEVDALINEILALVPSLSGAGQCHTGCQMVEQCTKCHWVYDPAVMPCKDEQCPISPTAIPGASEGDAG